MNTLFLSMILSSTPEVPEPIEARSEETVNEPDNDSGGEVKKCEEGVKGLKNGVLGLEFYLKDKKYHERVCPNLKWKQPSLEVYKERPKSYLPKECPRDII